MSLSTLGRSRSRHINRACFETLEARQLMSFTPAVNYQVGASAYPQAVVTADFNNDGHLDVARARCAALGARDARQPLRQPRRHHAHCG